MGDGSWCQIGEGPYGKGQGSRIQGHNGKTYPFDDLTEMIGAGDGFKKKALRDLIVFATVRS